MLAAETQEPRPILQPLRAHLSRRAAGAGLAQGLSTPTEEGKGTASAREARVKVLLKENSWERGSQSAPSQLWGPSGVPPAQTCRGGGGAAAPAPPAGRLGPPPAPWP